MLNLIFPKAYLVLFFFLFILKQAKERKIWIIETLLSIDDAFLFDSR